MNIKEFIEKARDVHGDKYDYCKVDYVNCRIKVCIICPEHGEFMQKPSLHIHKKCGCPLCARKKHSIFMKGRGLIYTKEKCKDIAMACTSRFDFERKNQRAYHVARINGWLDEYKWFSKPPRYAPIENIKNNLIYAYIFDSICYIGRTNNLKKRDKAHRQKRFHSNGKDCSSCVLRYSESNNIEIPDPMILETNLSLDDSREREEYWCNYYKSKGFSLLNKGKVGRYSGSIGACLKYGDYGKIVDAGKHYIKISDFQREHHSEYNSVRRMGLLNQFKNDCGMKEHAGRKKVDVFEKDGRFLFSCCDAREAERKTHVDYRLISMNCRCKIKTTKGFIFKFSKQ